MEKTMQSKEASALLGLSRAALSKMAKAKRIRGEIINGRLIINSEDVHALALENQKKMARVLGMSPKEVVQ